MAKNSFDININLKGFPQAQKHIHKTKQGLDRFRLSTEGLRRSVGALRNNMLLVSFAFGGILAGTKRLVAAYRKQIEAETLLTRGLKNIAGTSSNASKNLQELAASLQAVTTFGDEQIIMGQAQLATFQLTEDTIAALTERMLDLSVGSQTDLISTAKMLGKAFTGQATALTRAGVVIDQTALKQARANGATEEASFLLKELDKNYKGLSRSLAETPLGQLDQLNMKLSDTTERIGEAVIPIETWWTSLMLTLAESTEMAVGVIGKTFDGEWNKGILLNFLEAYAAFRKEQEKLIKGQKEFGAAGTLVTDAIKKQQIALDYELRSLKGITTILAEANLGERKYMGNKIERNKVANESLALEKMAEEGLIKGNELLKKRHEITARWLTVSAEADSLRKEANREAMSMLSETTSMWESNMKQRQDAELNTLRETAKYKEANSDEQKKMEERVLSGFKDEAVTRFRIEQASALTSIYMKAAEGVMKAAVVNPALVPIIKALGLSQAALVLAQKPPAYALGGDFITDGPQMIMVGDNPGGRERVQITPESSPNINGPSGNVVVNISAPLIDETVVESILPAIEKAKRMDLA